MIDLGIKGRLVVDIKNEFVAIYSLCSNLLP